MKTTHQPRPGYILIYSLLMIATLTAIATYIVTRASTYVPFVRAIEDREKALLIARSGIEVAIAQLAYVQKEPEAETTNAQTSSPQSSTNPPQKNQDDTLFLEKFLPTINRWQKYILTEEIDGIDAQMSICLMCEEGKININTIYDYKNKKFYGQGQPQRDWAAILQELCKNIERVQGGAGLFKALEAFLKNRTYKVLDVTELLLIPEFNIFRGHQFYAPPTSSATKEQKKSIYLTDIFTVESGKSTINPWFFSDALLQILSLPSVQPNDIAERTENSKAWLKDFRPAKSWKTDWAVLLQPMYQTDLLNLPKNIESIFDTSTNPRIFSVISEAQVGTITKQLFAILERTKHAYKNKIRYNVRLKKLYWL